MRTAWIEAAKGIQSIATIIALAIGGAWALRLYIEAREAYPKVVVEHNVKRLTLGEIDVQLLRATIKISNQGRTQLVISKGNIRLQQIAPLLACKDKFAKSCPADLLSAGANPVADDQGVAPWPLIAYKKVPADGYDVAIEPGEPDTLYFDFLIASDVKAVQLYSFISNESEKKDVGWKTITIHNLDDADIGEYR